MRPAEVPSEDIIAAGEELVAAGRHVTGFALRQKIGGGNPIRLKRIWEEYCATKNASQSQSAVELPIEAADEVNAINKLLSERIHAFAVDLNVRAINSAERRVEDLMREANKKREKAERELLEVEESFNQLQAEIDSLKDQLEEARAREKAQEAELIQLRERLSAGEEDVKGLRSEIDSWRQQAMEAREQAAKLEGQLESERAHSARLASLLADAAKKTGDIGRGRRNPQMQEQMQEQKQ